MVPWQRYEASIETSGTAPVKGYGLESTASMLRGNLTGRARYLITSSDSKAIFTSPIDKSDIHFISRSLYSEKLCYLAYLA